MELKSYVGSKIHITLLDGFYYSGEVIEADDVSLTLIDKFGKRVSVRKDNITMIREVLE